LSFFYRAFWGEHIHHGYWNDNESVERAQIQLMEELARRAAIPRGATVFDIGCGIGGSSLWLAQNLDCRVTGMTISPVQARMASRKARSLGLVSQVRFLVQDANQWQPEPASADAVWLIESSEHFLDTKGFFARCATALKPGGTLAVCAWLRRDGVAPDHDHELVAEIVEAMLTPSLDNLSSYCQWMSDAGLAVTVADDITRNVEATWAHCSRLFAKPALRFAARFTGAPTRRFVNSFPLMQKAYATGAMAFGLFVGKKRL
jgi:tocopherol O-methyltransferase